MKLIYNAITKGRYFKAGEDIPDNLLSDALRKYEVRNDDCYSEAIQRQREEADDIESKPAPRRPRAFVKRGNNFVPASKTDVIPGESLYWHRKRSMGVEEKFIAFAKA
jgi:hypothetical protein